MFLEKYYINYQGKKNKEEILSISPETLIKLFSIKNKQNSKRKNQFYYGENLTILRNLIENKDICGKVRLIYIDPPFSTNNKYKSRNQKDAYDDVVKGAKYIEFLRERLVFLRELLSADGSIYVHLDSNMVFEVKLIMDEIFGRNNFRNFITRKKSNRKNYTHKTYGNISDYILFYTKSNNYVWNRPYDKWDEESMKQQYPCIDESGRRYKKVPIHAPGLRNGETGKEWRGMLPPPGKHWQYIPAKLEEMEKNGEIYWSPNGNPRRKIYFDQSKGIPVQNIWLNYKDAHNQNISITGYPTEKNFEMMNLIVSASSNPGDIVLDCFAGSGTTLIAAEKQDRNWIGIDNSINAVETFLKRLAFGVKKMGDYVSNKNSSEIEASSNDSVINKKELSGIFEFFIEKKLKDKNMELLEEWSNIINDIYGIN